MEKIIDYLSSLELFLYFLGNQDNKLEIFFYGIFFYSISTFFL